MQSFEAVVDSVNIFSAVSLSAWLVVISIEDLRTHRIPNYLTLSLIAAGLFVSYSWSFLPFRDHILGTITGYLVLAAVGEIYFRRRGREGLGLGDAKLLGAAGAWIGWAGLPFVLLFASCSGLLYALVFRQSAPSQIAFGPHIAAGFWLVWLFGAPGLPPLWR